MPEGAPVEDVGQIEMDVEVQKTISDEQEVLALVAEAKMGNEEAAEALFDKFQPLLLKHTGRVSPDRRDDIEDLLNLVFVTSIKDYDPERGLTFGKYLEGEIKYEISHEFRKTRETSLDEESLEGLSGGIESAVAEELHMMRKEEINAALDLLDDPKTKDIVLMRFGFDPYETEMTYSEIADKVNLTPEAVRVRVNTALKSLSHSEALREVSRKRKTAYLLREAKKVALLFGDPVPTLRVSLSDSETV